MMSSSSCAQDTDNSPMISPVYSLILGANVLVVLSSDQAIKDLLDKRSSIYSSRPDMYLANITSGYLRVLNMVSISAVDLVMGYAGL